MEEVRRRDNNKRNWNKEVRERGIEKELSDDQWKGTRHRGEGEV